MPASSSFVSSFSIASLAQAIAAPFTALTAYSAGAIDEQGNLLKPESSIDPFEYFVIKLKKIFSELPMSYTKARLANYSSAFQYFTEQAKSFGISEIEFIMFMEGYIQGGKLLNEDMGVGAMGGAGAPGSLSTPSEYESKGGVAGYDVRMAAPLFRRTPVEIFDVTPEEFEEFKNAKAWRHIKDGETKKYLQRFQRRNPNGKMALRTKRPDTDEHDLYWITYTPKSFIEEYNLDINLLLNEQYHVDSEGRHIGHAISSLLDIHDDNEAERLTKGQTNKNLGAYATEYVGRGQLMLQGFKAASLHSKEHAQKWIDLSMTTAGKKATINDNNPDSAPDAWMYDASLKDDDFSKKVKKIDIGTDRKMGEIYVGREIKNPSLEKALGIGKRILDKKLFKDTVKEKSKNIEFRSEVAPLMRAKNPWLILHKQNMSDEPLETGPRFVLHEPDTITKFLQSSLYNWSPTWGGKRTKSGNIESRPAIQSTDLRVRSSAQPSNAKLEEIGLGAGYDILRTEVNSEEPKKAFTVDNESIEHAMDHIPDTYVDSRGRDKSSIHKALLKMYSTSPVVEPGKRQVGPARFTEPNQHPLMIKSKF